MDIRTFSACDRTLVSLERALEAVVGSPRAARPSPGDDLAEPVMTETERHQAAALMRVNHTGEVCAQALYCGQAALASDADNREHLLHAANEETDHLAWCAARLQQLGSRPSVFNPIWYVGSYLIGATAAFAGDRLSLGFVVETERQVEAHLGEHLQKLPAPDTRSRAILAQMQSDEKRHAEAAQERGGVALPQPLPRLMQLSSMLMKAVAYRI
ncbi:MAG: 2-polyprenyl-3-methyl-6-methoxy-1,4-benzoquinone monooxygenase [Rhodanobacter sp.]